MPESLSSAEKLERFLTGLARQRDLSANSQNQAFNRLLNYSPDALNI
jgi:hypothetical protein